MGVVHETTTVETNIPNSRRKKVIELAFAMGPPPDGAAGGAPPGSSLHLITMFALMFLVMYFLIFRPQQKRAKEHRDFLSALEKGDEVITTGGIHGKVTGITENVVTLEIADKVRIKLQRSNIAGKKPKTPEKTG